MPKPDKDIIRKLQIPHEHKCKNLGNGAQEYTSDPESTGVSEEHCK